MNKVQKHFVSAIDQKLAEFDASHPKSSAQLAEIAKYERIIRLRDQVASALIVIEEQD